MNGVRDYYLLERFTHLIARHADFPGKPGVVQDWADDIESRFALGELDADQKERLMTILDTGHARPARPCSSV